MSVEPPPKPEAPSQVPPVQYAPPYQLPPSAKKSNVWIFAVAALLIAVFVALPALGLYANRRPSGIFVDGRQLTQKEAREGLKELEQMVRNAKPSDPQSVVSGAEPQTILGRRLLDLMKGAAAIEAEASPFFEKNSLDTIIQIPMFADDKARAKAKQRLADLKDYSATYYKKSRGYVEEMVSVFSGTSKSIAEGAKQKERYLQRMEEASDAAILQAGRLIDFADKHESFYFKKEDALVFVEDGAQEKFQKIAMNYDKAVEKFAATARQIEQAELKQFQESKKAFLK